MPGPSLIYLYVLSVLPAVDPVRQLSSGLPAVCHNLRLIDLRKSSVFHQYLAVGNCRHYIVPCHPEYQMSVDIILIYRCPADRTPR